MPQGIALHATHRAARNYKAQFSVIIPVHNRADSIAPTLLSVKEQTFDDYECIVVDDGSDDGGLLQAVVDWLEDPRFIYVRRENGGGGAARNTGIDLASGRYIAFLDSDDLFLPEKLETFADWFRDHAGVVAYSYTLVDRGVGRYWIRPSRPIRSEEDVGEYLFVSNEFIPTPSIVVRRDIAATVRFDPRLRKGQDLDFCVRLQAAGGRFSMVEKPLVVWRDVSESLRASRTRGWEEALAWLKESHRMMTRRAILGYRATVLAYHLAGERPLVAATDLLRGWFFGGVPFKVFLRQILRAYMPRSLYRKAVNFVVGIAGKPKQGGKRFHHGFF